VRSAIQRVLAVAFVLAAFPMAISAQTPPTSPPPAAPEKTYPVVTVGGLTYAQYGYDFRDSNVHTRDFNAFDVTRAYININAELAKNIRARITPDISRVTDGSLSGSLIYRLKYGYVQFDNLTPHSWLRLGLHQTPWIDFEESIDRYRVQGTLTAERDGLIPGSGDFGVGYNQQIPQEYGEIQAGVYNGEGFKSAETNKYKSFQGRLTVRPFPRAGVAKGFRVSGFYNFGYYDEDRPRRLGIAMASFEHKHLVASGEFLAATERPKPLTADVDRRGYAGFLEVRQGMEGAAAFVRVSSFDPDKDKDDNSKKRFIGGVAYWLKWDKTRLGLLLNEEYVQWDQAANIPDESRLLAQAHIQF
jgi:hypothetical protein